jgi:hypothetical protein
VHIPLACGLAFSQLRTLVDANIPKNLTVGHEDHVTGSWMWSLPAKAKDARPQHAQRLDPTNNIMAFAPPEKDPYTGLVRADFYERASSWFYWWIPKTERMVLTHGMKTKEVCTLLVDMWGINVACAVDTGISRGEHVDR